MSIRPIDVHMTIQKSSEINQNNNQSQRFQNVFDQRQAMALRGETEHNAQTVNNTKRSDQNAVKNDEQERRQRERNKKKKKNGKDEDKEKMGMLDISI
jgi:hypothetical protein